VKREKTETDKEAVMGDEDKNKNMSQVVVLLLAIGFVIFCIVQVNKMREQGSEKEKPLISLPERTLFQIGDD
jgi:hypothetical protein